MYALLLFIPVLALHNYIYKPFNKKFLIMVSSDKLSIRPPVSTVQTGVRKGKLIVVEGADGSGKTVQTGLLVERLSREGYQVQMTDFPQYGRSFFADLIERYLKGELGWPQGLREHLKLHPFLTEKGSAPDMSRLRQSHEDHSGDDFPDGNHHLRRPDSDRTEHVISRPDEVNPYLTSILYAGDRWETKGQMYKWLDEGNIIVSNRYVCSNMAHQGAKIRDIKERKRFFEWIEALEYKVYAIPRADLTIYLHVPIEISQELIKTRGKDPQGSKPEVDLHEEDTEYLKRVQDTYMELAGEDTNWYTIECTKNNKIKSREEIAGDVWEIAGKILFAAL